MENKQGNATASEPIQSMPIQSPAGGDELTLRGERGGHALPTASGLFVAYGIEPSGGAVSVEFF